MMAAEYACYEELKSMAAASPDREICGFIMAGWIPLSVTNVAHGDREFYMDEAELLHVYQCHRDEIVGVYHSHPGGSNYPSDSDETFAPKGMRYWIVTEEKVTEWEFRDGRARQVLADNVRVLATEARQIPAPRAEQSCC